MTSAKDKLIEKNRYDKRAEELIKRKHISDTSYKDLNSKSYSNQMLYYLRSPYEYFEGCLKKYTKNEYLVLEVGSGVGNYVSLVSKMSHTVYATDISNKVLEVSAEKNKNLNNVIYSAADMEKLPFEEGMFDLVLCAGSLSYGDINITKNEIKRVLKSDGYFICVDSLNNNPIYRLRRYWALLRGQRSKSTIDNMPTITSIKSLREDFKILDLRFFGSISWILTLLPNHPSIKRFSDRFDNFIRCKSSAFKFVLVTKVK